MTTYLLHFTPWSMPSLPEVLISIKSKFADDPGLTVMPGRNAELCICHLWSRGGKINFPWKKRSHLHYMRVFQIDNWLRVPSTPYIIVQKARGKRYPIYIVISVWKNTENSQSQRNTKRGKRSLMATAIFVCRPPMKCRAASPFRIRTIKVYWF